MVMGAQNTNTVFFSNTILGVPEIFPMRHNMPMGYLDRVKELRAKKGWTQAELGERIGVQQATIGRWETGDREPSFDQLFRLAELLGTDVPSLIDPTMSIAVGPRLFVKGNVAAGVWREAAEWPASEWQSFTGRSDVTADIKHRFGLRVVGDSMDQVYPDGTIVECVSVFGRVEPTPGKRVVVLRENDDHEFEATVKELVLNDGALWAVPRSSNPVHTPIKLNGPEKGIIETRIIAVVVASVRPE